MGLTQTRIHASPATLSGVGMQIESSDNGFIAVQALTNQLTRAGLVAVLGAVNTYLSGLSATNLAAIPGHFRVEITTGRISFPCRVVDAPTVASTLAGILATPANVTRG